MKKLVSLLPLLVIMTVVSTANGAAKGGAKSYECYTNNAVCTLNGSGGSINTTASYDWPCGPTTNVSCNVPQATLYADVAAVQNKPTIANVTYSLNYRCGDGTTTTCATQNGTNGSPLQFAVLLNTGFAWITAYDCGQTGSISTSDSGCDVKWVDGFTHTLYTYPNWAAFAAAHPTFTVSSQAPDVEVGPLTTTVTITNFVGGRLR